ncbi:ABC transporter ATP-binding protein [Actinoplanes oblitus]|uniref:ABC transporter ATP-binding protein n=1 Tax=Actinoplanes oblitus TaxID=3040509 RepID=A0ABY8WTT9_9ACTN|nr:ABC transporter ATP-binding protein [Actinoplanes oblitus]WIM99749.1 ABC transporter ATP-binding protein [Actinoplanes oblitus]
MTKTAPAVAARGLTKAYGPVRAVDGVAFTVERGAAIAVLGPNGAGKSTIIHLILGLLTPDRGTVTVLGRTPERAMRAGLLGAMPQEGDLVARLSVRELIGFVRRTYPAPMPLDEVLRIAGLTGVAGRRANRLSGGQAQRVRFALALAGDPDLVVLDEPTAALDVESRRELWTAIRAYVSRGKSVIFSTHYLQEADENADRVLVIAGGRVVADDSAEEIKRLAVGRTVSVDIGNGLAEAVTALPGVIAAQRRGDRVHLRSRDADATVLALARLGAVRNLEVTSGGLEEAFLALTHPEKGVAG